MAAAGKGGCVMKRTALRPGKSSLKRSGPPERRTRIKTRSDKTARIYVTRRQLVAALLSERPWCEIRWDAKCLRRSAQIHEPEMRSRGTDILDPDRCVAACAYCHDAVHAHPAEATERDWLIPSGKRRAA